MADKKGADKVGKVTEWRKSKLTWFLFLGPLAFFSGWIYFKIYPIGEIHFPSFSFHSSTAPARPSETTLLGNIPEEVRNASDSDEQVFFDDGVKEVSVDVPVGSWSAEVVTPRGSKDYRVNVKPDKTVFYVKFADGHIEKIGGGEKRFKDFKIRRGIMRFYGTVPGQKASVMIED